MDHLAGRKDARVAAHLEACPACAEAAAAAARLLAAGRRAAAAPVPTKRALARAERIFRDARAARAPSLLELVFDSFLKPVTAAAVRSGAVAARFLRFAGDVTVELEVREGARGRDVRGQLTPRDYAQEVTLRAGKVGRRAKVEPDGTFVLRAVPRGEVEIRIGSVRIANLDL
jgi:anti-sigma factor RsiW